MYRCVHACLCVYIYIYVYGLPKGEAFCLFRYGPLFLAVTLSMSVFVEVEVYRFGRDCVSV